MDSVKYNCILNYITYNVTIMYVQFYILLLEKRDKNRHLMLCHIARWGYKCSYVDGVVDGPTTDGQSAIRSEGRTEVLPVCVSLFAVLTCWSAIAHAHNKHIHRIRLAANCISCRWLVVVTAGYDVRVVGMICEMQRYTATYRCYQCLIIIH